MRKVLVGFSGGIDSFYAAYLLKERGFEVIPVYLKLLPDADTEKVKKSGDLLGTKVTVVDLTDVFKKEVISYFVSYYKSGLTPNPCAICNREVKLKYLYKLRNDFQADFIATGHYARVDFSETFGKNLVYRGMEKSKEQSYFLSLVERKIFDSLLLPLGEFTKEEVVRRATELGFSYRGESQDICFIEKDYASFLKPFIEEKPGVFRLEDGTVVGKHRGYFRYTVGQRRGLGISYKCPLYVLEIKPEENTVVVGPKERVLKEEIFVWKVNWHVSPEEWGKIPVQVQVRYRSKPVEVESVEYLKNGIYRVKLAAKVDAPAPGQVCAFYSNDLLLGGGEITKEGAG